MIGSNTFSRTYKVSIEELLGYLRENRDQHLKIVEEAQENFRKQVIERLEDMLAQARSNQQPSMSLGLRVPSVHTDAFDNAIGLLEMTLRAGETFIEITSDEYERFVRNNWEWTREFISSNAPYSSQI